MEMDPKTSQTLRLQLTMVGDPGPKTPFLSRPSHVHLGADWTCVFGRGKKLESRENGKGHPLVLPRAS